MNQVIRVDAGETLIQEGAKDTRLFVLQSGELEIRKEGKLVSLIEVPSSIVGEISVVLEKPRTCSVVAKSDCELVLVGHSINEIIENSPKLTKLIMQELAERLEKTTSQFASVATNLL
jgi:CRP-like cAMP-binding protein